VIFALTGLESVCQNNALERDISSTTLKNPLFHDRINELGGFILGAVTNTGQLNEMIHAGKFCEPTREGDGFPRVTIAPNQQSPTGQNGE
jgi:hypothetical protein